MADRRMKWELAWKRCFRDGPEWLPRIMKYRWNFSNLEDAFQEGGMWEDATFEEDGMLDGKKLYIFTHVEVLFPEVNDPQEQTYIPVFIMIESSFPPSDKIAFKSLQTDFYNPFKAGTTVDIVYQTQAEAEPLHFEYHWEEEPEIFTDALITFNLLPAAHRDSFQELLRERCEEGRRAYQEALPAQEELRAEWIHADDFENMRFYKFYPDATDDTPDISSVKTRFINKYFGDADFVF